MRALPGRLSSLTNEDKPNVVRRCTIQRQTLSKFNGKSRMSQNLLVQLKAELNSKATQEELARDTQERQHQAGEDRVIQLI